MAETQTFQPGELEAEARALDNRNRWLLSMPAIFIIVFAAAGPLLVMVLYSFLAPGDYGNVKWEFSLEGWMNTVVQRDIFDDTLVWADAHLSIFWRSLSLSLLTTVLTLLFRPANRVVHRHATAGQARVLALPDHRAVLGQPAGAHHRDSGTDPLGRGDQPGADEGWRNRRPHPDDVHQLRHRLRHDLCLPAADGAADLCLGRQARFPAGRGGA